MRQCPRDLAVAAAVVLSVAILPACRTRVRPATTVRERSYTPRAYVNESHFLASEPIRAIVSLAQRGGAPAGEASITPGAPDPERREPIFGAPAPRFTVVLPGVKEEVSEVFKDHIWAPADYEAVAERLVP